VLDVLFWGPLLNCNIWSKNNFFFLNFWSSKPRIQIHKTDWKIVFYTIPTLYTTYRWKYMAHSYILQAKHNKIANDSYTRYTILAQYKRQTYTVPYTRSTWGNHLLAVWTVFRIRKNLIRIRSRGSRNIRVTDPDLGGHLTTDQAGSETYLEIFEIIEKNILADIIKFWIFSWNFFESLINSKDPDPDIEPVFGSVVQNHGSGSISLPDADPQHCTMYMGVAVRP